MEKALIAGFQVEPFNTDTRNRRQRTVLPVQSRNSHIRSLPSLIQTVLNRAYPFSERKKKNGRKLFYIRSVTSDGIGSLASIADHFGKD